MRKQKLETINEKVKIRNHSIQLLLNNAWILFIKIMRSIKYFFTSNTCKKYKAWHRYNYLFEMFVHWNNEN